MSNILTLSKQNYYPKNIDMLLEVDGVGDYVNVEQFKHALSILTDYYATRLTPTHLNLIHPEKYFPPNASAKFWTNVDILIGLGVEFEVITSDVRAACWLRWDHMYLEKYDQDILNVTRREFTDTYGKSYSTLNQYLKF